MNLRLLIITLLVALVVIGNNWLSVQREEASRGAETTAPHVPDYFLRNFAATTMGPGGTPDHRLEAAYMVHYGDDDTMELKEPRLTLNPRDPAAWQIDAAQGQVSDNGARLELSGGVHMAYGENAELNVATENLHFRLDQHYAETQAPITVIDPDGKVTAVGLRAYLTQERLVLLAKVRGEYVPPR